MNGGADKVSAFSVMGEAAMPTGSACVWVGAGGIGALADWFVSSPSSRGSIADGVFGCDAAKALFVTVNGRCWRGVDDGGILRWGVDPGHAL